MQDPSKHYKDELELKTSLNDWLAEYSEEPLSSDETAKQTALRIFCAVRADPALLQVSLKFQLFIYNVSVCVWRECDTQLCRWWGEGGERGSMS